MESSGFHAVAADFHVAPAASLLSLASGELRPFPVIPPKAAFALLYLIVAGSLVGFTAFVWLLGRMPASRVALVVGSVVLTMRETG